MKDIPGFEDLYAITDTGKVWSHITKKWLSLGINTTGYYFVTLYGGIHQYRRQYLVNRLVAATYLGLDLLNQSIVAHHKDTNKRNNAVNNLEVMQEANHSNHQKFKDTMTHKFCRKCELLKLRSEFHLDNDAVDGLVTHCKSCCRRKYYDRIKLFENK